MPMKSIPHRNAPSGGMDMDFLEASVLEAKQQGSPAKNHLIIIPLSLV